MRRPYVIFAVFALCAAVLIPAWAISREGERPSPQDVPAELEEGRELFVVNCGACHVLALAGTDGVVGPNLDRLLAPAGATPDPEATQTRVLNAIEEGIAGRMPAGIVTGPDAEAVAGFVAETAGQ